MTVLKQEKFLDPCLREEGKKLQNLLETILGKHNYIYLKIQELIFDLKTKNKNSIKKEMSVACFDFFLILSPEEGFA